MLTLKCFLKMTRRDLVVASTRHHLARLLKYYPRRPCAPSFVKSRILRPLQRHFLLFQQIFFILACIHAGSPKVPPRVLAHAGAITAYEVKVCKIYRSINAEERLTMNDLLHNYEVKVFKILRSINLNDL